MNERKTLILEVHETTSDVMVLGPDGKWRIPAGVASPAVTSLETGRAVIATKVKEENSQKTNESGS